MGNVLLPNGADAFKDSTDTSYVIGRKNCCTITADCAFSTRGLMPYPVIRGPYEHKTEEQADRSLQESDHIAGVADSTSIIFIGVKAQFF